VLGHSEENLSTERDAISVVTDDRRYQVPDKTIKQSRRRRFDPNADGGRGLRPQMIGRAPSSWEHGSGQGASSTKAGQPPATPAP
jgi:hypothetical protein